METAETPLTPHVRRSRHVHSTIPSPQGQTELQKNPVPSPTKPIARHGHHTRLAAALHLRDSKCLMDILDNSQDYDTMIAPFFPENTPPKKIRVEKSTKISTKAKKPRSGSKRQAPTLAPTPVPQILQELHTHEESSINDIDASTPLVDIPFDILGLMVRFRPTRHYIGKNTARNIKKIVHGLILQLQSLDQRGLLASDEATSLVKKLFLAHFIILGFHIDKEKSPFKISQELLDNSNWEDYCVCSYQLREVHEMANTAQKRKDQQKMRCEKLIKQGFISKAVSCLQEKSLPIPKDLATTEKLKLLHPPDRHTMGDRHDDGTLHEILLDQQKIDSIPDVSVDPNLVSRLIRTKKRRKTPSGTSGIRNEHLQDLIRGPDGEQGLEDITWLLEAIINLKFADDLILYLSFAELTAISKSNGDPDSIRPIAMCETIRKLCFDVLLDKFRPDYTPLFAGSNYAVNGPNGIDRLNHAYRESFERHREFDTIVLDATAAYQNFNRKEALRQILDKVPGMFKFFNAIYRECTSVWFNMDDNNTQEILSTREATRDARPPLSFTPLEPSALFSLFRNT